MTVAVTDKGQNHERIFAFWPSPLRARSTRSRPAFETLEDRQLLSTAAIGGYVFNDLTNDGLYHGNDTPIAGNTLELFHGTSATGNPIASAVTDANGFYQFTTDASISQTPTTMPVLVTFASQKTGWTQTASLAQFNPSMGTLLSVDIINTATLQTEFQFENLDSEPGTLTGSINGNVTLSVPGASPLVAQANAQASFNASAFDGTIDFGGTSGYDSGVQTETGTSQTLTISDPNLLQEFEGTGNLTLSAHAGSTSTASGPGNLLVLHSTNAGAQVEVIYHYIPSDALKPGTYTILQTSVPSGYLDGLKSSGGTVIPNSVGVHSITVTLPASGNSGNNDFAALQPAAVSGFVYLDGNDNGIKNPGETGIAGVSLTLTGTSDVGAITTLTTQTAADGSYNFGNLRPGTYIVTETTQPAGYLTGLKTRGNVTPIAGSAASADVINSISVGPGSTAANNNIAKIQSSSLSGYVYVDLSNNGIRQGSDPPVAGTTVTLTGTNDLGSAVHVVIQTNTSGQYDFTSLRPGSYTITKTPPPNLLEGKNTLGTVNGVTAGTKGSNDQFFVTLGQGSVGLEYDYGELLPPVVPQTPVPKVTPPPPPLSKVLFLASTIGKRR